jgi:hypothetical protein
MNLRERGSGTCSERLIMCAIRLKYIKLNSKDDGVTIIKSV